MEGRCRLALGRAQVGLEAMPVAAVRVAVRAQRRERGLGLAAREEELEAPAVQQPGMSCHEAACGGQQVAHLQAETA